jgi:putative transposase
MSKHAAGTGKIIKGQVIALAAEPRQARQWRRDDGARRFAFNWAVTQIRASFDAGAETGTYDNEVWSAWSLRKRWNQVKEQATAITDRQTGEITGSWWRECSKEAYANGIADAVTALKNWHDSRTGERQGPAVRFPKRKKKGKDRVRCTYTTGALRVEGPRTLVLPGVGRVRTAENIRSLWRHVRSGTGRVLAATIREKAGRWSVALKVEIDAPQRLPDRTSTVGVDVGIGGDLLIVMRSDGTVVDKVPNPRALRASLADLRRANRALARKTEDSSRWKKARTRLARVAGRTADIRKDVIHKATTHLAKTHGAVVIEDLAPRQHMRGLRSHRKSWIDASAGEMRRQLTYKAGWYDCDLWVADRWYPSSKTCCTPGCGYVNADLQMGDRIWTCPACGTFHDRDENAGINLARLPASWAEAQSNGKTAPVRHVVMKRVNLPGREAA